MVVKWQVPTPFKHLVTMIPHLGAIDRNPTGSRLFFLVVERWTKYSLGYLLSDNGWWFKKNQSTNSKNKTKQN